MIDLNNLNSHTVPRPEVPTIIGTAKEFDTLPETHQAQLLFLNEAASKFLYKFLSDAHLITSGFWAPFEKGNFKTVEEFSQLNRTDESKQLVKKWLYQRGIAFGNWVYVLQNGPEPAMLMTWKMVIKYSADLFIHHDVVIFDQTTNWCLVFFHEDKLFFGKDNIYDTTEDDKRMEELNERKKKFPDFKHPYL
jgi:hypothetical protein